MIKRTFLTAVFLLLLTLLVPAALFSGGNREQKKMQEVPADTIHTAESIPAIDKNVPEALETAVFALG